MPRTLIVSALVALLVAAGLFTFGGLGHQLPFWSWARGGASPWPTHERSDLTALVMPGQLVLHADVRFADVQGSTLAFLLNDGLKVHAATVAGRAVEVTHSLDLGTRYHGEGRVVLVHLAAAPADGRVRVELLIAGAAEQGEQGSDWRGILYVGESEVRLSEQTNWHPQVPLSADGPGKARAPYTLHVAAPSSWELFAPGRLQAGDPASDAVAGAALKVLPPAFLAETLGARADQPLRHWRFASERPAQPNLVGGLRQRAAVHVGDTRVLTLLREEHAALGPAFVDLGAELLSLLGQQFGASAPGSLCVFEQSCRSDSSYNWAAESLVVFDRQALGGDVPLAKLAHELGHLWWGQTWLCEGPGERFLTEGGAEASAWTALDLMARTELLSGALGRARGQVEQLVERGDSAALSTVGFGSDDYTTLAYAKGGLVHRYVWGSLGDQGRERFFAALGSDRESRPLTLADWRAALAAVDPTLAVPWVDQAGDVQVRLLDARYDRAARRLTLSVSAQAHPRSPDFPATVRAGLAVTGRGFVKDVVLDLTAGVTTHAIDLGDVRPWVPAGRDVSELQGPQGEPVVHALTLDPEDLLPAGVLGDPSVVLEGPRLTRSEPSLGSQVPFGLTELTLSFDRPVSRFDAAAYQATRPALSSSVRTPEVLAVAWSADGLTATLTTAPLSPDCAWVLPLRGAVRGEWGDLPVEAALTFSTAPSDDREPPRVVSVVPPVGAVGVDPGLSEIVVTFDEAMQRGVGFDSPSVAALKAEGFAWPETDYARWGPERRVLTIPITAPLRPGATYKLPIGRPLRDLSGNLAARDELLFTVADG